MLHPTTALWVEFLLLLGYAQAAKYLTKPYINPPEINVVVNKLPHNDSEFLFWSPYISQQDGSVVHDMQGNLVWHAFSDLENGENAHYHNVEPIIHDGKPHLVYSRTEDIAPEVSVAEIFIMDDKYREVARFRPSTVNGVNIDCHDFAFLQNDSKILEIEEIYHEAYKTDLGLHPIREGGLRVLDIETRKVEFEWRSLDHVAVNESLISLDNEDGNDYFHANSITITPSGDFLLSAYNVGTIYLISHVTGSILWRLGGARSDFTFTTLYSLTYQHNIRVRPLSSVHLPPSLRDIVCDKTHLAISLFDNAFDTTRTPTASSSSALVVLLDLVAMNATVIERYPHPSGSFAAMFGSVEFLANGDRFVGWGSLKEATQFRPNGEVVWHAEMGARRAMIGSLRTLKREWHSARRLDSKPDGFGYSWVCGWRSVLYASWNGATEVGSWRFYGGNETVQEGNWGMLGVVPKDGFETMMMAKEFVRWAYVEAVAEDGEILGRSDPFKTWVPPVVESRGCSEHRCPETLYSFKDTSDSCFGSLGTSVVDGRHIALDMQNPKQSYQNEL